MGRSATRELLFKLVYEYIIREEKNELTLAKYIKEVGETDRTYLIKAYNGIIENRKFIIEQISKYSVGFALDRIYKIDLAILMLAVYEVYFCDDIPDSVAANEAIELTKTYSTDKSYSYVNGLLASIIKEKNNK